MEIEELIEKFAVNNTLNSSIRHGFDKSDPITKVRVLEQTPSTKKERTANIKNTSAEYGIKALLRLMPRDELATLYQQFEEIPEEGKSIPTRTKVFLIRRLKTKIMDIGLDNYCKKKCPPTHINIINKYVVTPKDQFATGVPDELRKAGFEMLLWETPIAILQKMCAEAKIQVERNVQKELVKALLTGKVPKSKPKAKPRAVVECSDVKLALTKENELTYHDIFQHYNLEELRKFCRKKGLKISGTKPEVIKRILSFFEGTYEASPAKPKKPDTAAATKPKKAAPVEAEEESEDEAIESDEDDDDEEEDAPAPIQRTQKAATAAAEEDDEDDEDEDDDDEAAAEVIMTPKKTGSRPVPVEKSPVKVTKPAKSTITRKGTA